MSTTIETMFAAAALVPLGPRDAPSGIVKSAAAPPWRIGRDGLSGDRQGDLRHHGGPEKALHHYPRDHYELWAKEGPELVGALAAPPAFGENISTLGVTERDVCVGDVFALGSALLQVSQGRQPCWKLNARFARPDMARRVQTSGRTGWYYRVLREGVAEPGDRLGRIERPLPDWPLSRLNELLYLRTLDRDALAQMAELRELATSWRALAARRLARRVVEDWTARLVGG
ncbi:MOSC domain-containing protein [Methylosinus sp. KRF6]|uniref:MOSC domain-containing protein n=1 Tax=Methylosinus sp. KRF6 TaxID=2846853 RepID=UPI001C0C58E2|nr:MOSC domain-containing protein [Methylosinus sp. KRF6]MBU3888381.1 MOSC domain-containing protein [Methylosinus sp. KRF6]